MTLPRTAWSAAVLVGTGTLLAASACGHERPATTGTARVQRVTIDGTDQMRFVPSHVVVEPGTVVVTLHDTGQEPHNIDFPTLHVRSPLITDGKSTSVTLHVRDGRTYPFDCDIHVSEGMVGTLVVR